MEVSLGLIGSKGIGFFHPLGLDVVAQHSGMGDSPSVEELIGIANRMFDAYREGKIDAIYIAYNKFINTMSQKPTFEKLVPLPELDNDNLGEKKQSWDYLYEPDQKFYWTVCWFVI